MGGGVDFKIIFLRFRSLPKRSWLAGVARGTAGGEPVTIISLSERADPVFSIRGCFQEFTE